MKDFKMSLLFDYYGDFLSEKQREIFDLYYNDDLSLAEISAEVGITRQGVRDSVKRTEQQLVELEDKLKFYSKCKEIKETADKYKNGTAEISKLLDLIDNL